MNPYLIIALGIAFLSAGAGGFKLGMDHVIAGQAREDEQIAKAVNAGATAAAEAISKLKITQKIIQNEIQKEVRYEKVYSDVACNNTARGLQLLNQALTGDKSATDSKLPEANPAGR